MTDLRQNIRELVLRRLPDLPAGTVTGGGSGDVARYAWGTRLAFGQGGTARPYQAGGWSVDELGYVWTDGPAATITGSAPSPDRDVVLRLRARALFPASRTSQPVRVRLNGQPVLRWNIVGVESWYFGRLCEFLWRDSSRFDLSFEPEFPVSPRALGLGEDDRQLGLAVSQLQLEVER